MFALGIDIGGSSIKAGLVDVSGFVVDRRVIATNNKHFVSSLYSLIDIFIKKSNKQDRKLIGIGIGTPGFVDSNGFINGAYNIPGLNELPLLKMISNKYKLPVYISNDASNAARGEYLFGLSKSYSNFIFITIGTGVGGGIIINDNLFSGESNQGGEIGHITVVPDGILCSCGNYGCLEAYSSATAILAYIHQALVKGIRSSITSYKDKGIDGSLIARLAKEGDNLCTSALMRSAYYLGIVISNLLSTLNLPLVVIGGGIAESGEFFLDKIRETIDNNILSELRASYQVVRARLGKDAGIIGSASYVFMEE